jgi:ribonuclease HI
MQKALQHAEN